MRYQATALLLASLIFNGCATGSYIVTGTPRPAVPTKAVQVYSSVPERFEIIGTVYAFYGQGSGQPATDACVAELKRQAAKIGANGLVVGSLSNTNGQTHLATGSTPVYVANGDGTSLSGTAIYVTATQ